MFDVAVTPYCQYRLTFRSAGTPNGAGAGVRDDHGVPTGCAADAGSGLGTDGCGKDDRVAGEIVQDRSSSRERDVQRTLPVTLAIAARLRPSPVTIAILFSRRPPARSVVFPSPAEFRVLQRSGRRRLLSGSGSPLGSAGGADCAFLSSGSGISSSSVWAADSLFLPFPALTEFQPGQACPARSFIRPSVPGRLRGSFTAAGATRSRTIACN